MPHATQARAHVLERFREDAHGNFYNPDELAAETEELFGKSFEQARCYTPLVVLHLLGVLHPPCSAALPCSAAPPCHATCYTPSPLDSPV